MVGGRSIARFFFLEIAHHTSKTTVVMMPTVAAMPAATSLARALRRSWQRHDAPLVAQRRCGAAAAAAPPLKGFWPGPEACYAGGSKRAACRTARANVARVRLGMRMTSRYGFAFALVFGPRRAPQALQTTAAPTKALDTATQPMKKLPAVQAMQTNRIIDVVAEVPNFLRTWPDATSSST